MGIESAGSSVHALHLGGGRDVVRTFGLTKHLHVQAAPALELAGSERRCSWIFACADDASGRKRPERRRSGRLLYSTVRLPLWLSTVKVSLPMYCSSMDSNWPPWIAPLVP